MRLLRWILCVVIVGCGAPDGHDAEPLATNVVVRVTTDASEYATGSAIRLNLSNWSDGAIELNLCTDNALERNDGSVWRLERDPDVGCPYYLMYLRRGGTVWTDFLAPATPGLYRYTYRHDSGVRSHTDSFEVR